MTVERKYVLGCKMRLLEVIYVLFSWMDQSLVDVFVQKLEL